MTPRDHELQRRSVLSGLVAGAALAVGACTSAGEDTQRSGAPATATPATRATTGPDAPTATGPSSATTSAGVPTVLLTSGPDIATGPATSSGVALTFHGAGDIATAHAVLDVLRARGARVTVFAVGTWLDTTPSLGREIVAAGHALGNHTWSHPVLTRLDLAAATDEVRRGADAVAAAVGTPGLLFRPSGTPTSTATIRAAAAAAGYHRSISYDVDSLDYTDPGADAVVANVAAGVHPGAIVSLHLGHPGTLTALPRLLDLLATRRLRAVTVPELLGAV
ncbi:MAG: polysaccharide deacetylase family protein [Actinomycetota bacterium]|nr:polysaccharide deacetylase family protein [Actinomycetota bacterium]